MGGSVSADILRDVLETHPTLVGVADAVQLTESLLEYPISDAEKVKGVLFTKGPLTVGECTVTPEFFDLMVYNFPDLICCF